MKNVDIRPRKTASDPFISVANNAIKLRNSSFWSLNWVDCSDSFFFQIRTIFFWGGAEIRNPRKSILLKIGHKKSSIKDKRVWFLLKCVKFNCNLFKRNQSFLTLIELFLWPIFRKIDLRGFRISPPTKNIFDQIWKKNYWDNLLNLSLKMSYYATL